MFCLVTDLLDPEEYPALDLAGRYPNRWGCETVIGHHKTDMGAGQPVLRSKDPACVEQEMWGRSSLSTRHYARLPGSARPPWVFLRTRSASLMP